MMTGALMLGVMKGSMATEKIYNFGGERVEEFVSTTLEDARENPAPGRAVFQTRSRWTEVPRFQRYCSDCLRINGGYSH